MTRPLPRGPLGWLPLGPLLLLAVVPPADAHESGYSSLMVSVEGPRIEAEWEATRRDVHALLGRDVIEGGPELTEAEDQALTALLLDRISFHEGDAPCPGRVSTPGDGAPAPSGRDALVRRISATCPLPVKRLRVEYDLFFDLDERHRAYFNVRDAVGTHVGVFHDQQRRIVVDIRRADPWRTFRDYLAEGVRHIAGGLDHLLFLVALLLPAVVRGTPGGPSSLRACLGRVAAIVTAFTVAHSLTLSLAVLGFVRLPSRWTETAIAASVFVVAWNNVRPLWPDARAGVLLAGSFGLLHGLGFASALSGLGLPRSARALALVSFNLGVELGQLAVVAVALPVLYALGATAAYRRWGLRLGSLGIAWIALLWTIERGLGVRLVGLG